MFFDVLSVVQSLQIFTALIIGEILYFQNPNKYKNLHSARVQAQKLLNSLAEQGKLEKCKGFYRVPGCKSEFKPHRKKLSYTVAHFFKIPSIQPIVKCEQSFPVGLIADCCFLLIKNDVARCGILEVVNYEKRPYLQSKINEWRNWKDALTALSELFNYKIPHFDIVTAGIEHEGTFEFSRYIDEVRQCKF